MPEVYKKFRDSQGLASISQALKASQAAKEADPLVKQKTRTAEAEKETKRYKRDTAKSKTAGQVPSPALGADKKGKRREKEGAHPNGDAKASEGVEVPRKKGRKAEASAGDAAVRNAESASSAPAHGLAGDGPIRSSEGVDPLRKKRRKAETAAGGAAGKDAEALPSAPGQAQAEGGLTGSELPEGHEREQNPQAQTFRDFYMKTFSSAFASELFDLRQAEGEKLSLDLLLRHMERGINIFSNTERELMQQRQPTS